MKDLSVLNLKGCGLLTDGVFDKIRLMKRLRHLLLEGCEGLSLDGILNLKDYCPDLQVTYDK